MESMATLLGFKNSILLLIAFVIGSLSTSAGENMS